MAVVDDPALHAELTDPLMREGLFAEGDPFALYARLRREAPVARNEAMGYWALSRHADVVEVSKAPDRFCSGKGILTFEIGVEYPSPPTMMHTDPPEHTAYRRIVSPGFRPSVMRAVEADVRRRTAALLDAVEPGAVTDVVPAVSVPLPLQVIAALLGIPEADLDRFFEWSEAAIPGANDWSAEKRQALMAEMQAYLLDAVRSGRDHPKEDVVSVVGQVEVDGRRLTDEELVMFLNQLLVAGNETTRNAMSGGVAALARAPDQWRRLVDDRSLIPTAVEEILRWTTPVIYFMRTATRDTEIGGVPLAAGDPVVLLYASANRDEDEYGPTADRFDVGRSPNHHVALGFGTHFCLGAALARLELRILLEELLDRFRAVEPAGEVVGTPSNIIAGVRSAPVVFSA
ncbi:MAG: cytochrome [Acidimicrobiales bacterium]|jgi:cytochrome P450|nr:cytochrome [Acidimicrobiales bacterium]